MASIKPISVILFGELYNILCKLLNSSFGITMGAAIILNRGGGHTKVDCRANNANCDMLAVLIPFQIFNLSAVQSFSSRKSKKFGFFFSCIAAIFLHTAVHSQI